MIRKFEQVIAHDPRTTLWIRPLAATPVSGTSSGRRCAVDRQSYFEKCGRDSAHSGMLRDACDQLLDVLGPGKT